MKVLEDGVSETMASDTEKTKTIAEATSSLSDKDQITNEENERERHSICAATNNLSTPISITVSQYFL